MALKNVLKISWLSIACFVFAVSFASRAQADSKGGGYSVCKNLPNYQSLKNALEAAQAADSNGLNFEMWGTVVARDGTVCAVAFTGVEFDDQWLGSRVISAQKANTANAFSLDNLSLSTANLYSAVQPGGSLFGLQESNPVNPSVAYKGNHKLFGTKSDPMTGRRIGGVNVFGGGLALYNTQGQAIGAIGVSGDTSCRDHIFAWIARDQLELDNIPGGVNSIDFTDNIEFLAPMELPNGFKHPTCGFGEETDAQNLSTNYPVGP